jgi:TatA/E family protein of Tat protein translocase
MFGFGTSEIVLTLCIILLFFGAKKLPELPHGLGKGIREFTDATQESQSIIRMFLLVNSRLLLRKYYIKSALLPGVYTKQTSMNVKEYLKGTPGFAGLSSVHITGLQLVLLFVVASLIGCSKESNDITAGGSTTTTTSNTIAIDSATTSSGAPEGNTDRAANADDLLANSTFSSTVTIGFGSTVTISNPLAAKGVTITESNGDVIINSTVAEVAYVLSGTTTNGSVKLYSDKKFKLTLNGVNITNADGPAINIQSGKRAFLVLADNTTNTLTDGATYTASGTEDMKATLFSEGQLIVSGNGSLSVKGNYKHAIASDDYIRVISGNITVIGAASDGIHTNDAFIADGGTISMTTSGDGIQCDEGYIVINNGVFTINVVDKGISATYDTDATMIPI